MNEEKKRIKDPKLREMFDKNSIYSLLEKKEHQIKRFKEKELFRLNSELKSHLITKQQHEPQLRSLESLTASKYAKLDKQKILLSNWLSIVDTLLDEGSSDEGLQDSSLDDLQEIQSDDSLETRRLKRIQQELEKENNSTSVREMLKVKKKKKLAYKTILEKEKAIKRKVQDKLLMFEKGKL